MSARLFWLLAAKNLIRNRRRTLATGLAVVFGYVGLVLLSAYIFRAYMSLRTSAVYLNQKAHIAVMKKDSLTQFPAKPKLFILSSTEQKWIRDELALFKDQIEFSSSFLSGTGLLSMNGKAAPVSILGLEPKEYEMMLNHPMMRKWAPDWIARSSKTAAEELVKDAHGISITNLLAQALDIENRDIGSDAQLVTKTFFGDLGVGEGRIRAHHTTGIMLLEESSVIVPLPFMQELLATEGVEYVGIFLNDIGDTPSIATKLRADLGVGFDIWTYDSESWSPMFVGNMNFLAVMAILFVILILGAVTLSLVNTTTLNVLERTRELGTLRAIGFAPEHLLQIFRRETFLLTSGSLLTGLLTAELVVAFVNNLNIRFKPPGTQSDVQFLLIIHFVAVAIMALLVMAMTMMATEYVVRRKNSNRIISLLTDAGG